MLDSTSNYLLRLFIIIPVFIILAFLANSFFFSEEGIMQTFFEDAFVATAESTDQTNQEETTLESEQLSLDSTEVSESASTGSNSSYKVDSQIMFEVSDETVKGWQIVENTNNINYKNFSSEFMNEVKYIYERLEEYNKQNPNSVRFMFNPFFVGDFSDKDHYDAELEQLNKQLFDYLSDYENVLLISSIVSDKGSNTGRFKDTIIQAYPENNTADMNNAVKHYELTEKEEYPDLEVSYLLYLYDYTNKFVEVELPENSLIFDRYETPVQIEAREIVESAERQAILDNIVKSFVYSFVFLSVIVVSYLGYKYTIYLIGRSKDKKIIKEYPSVMGFVEMTSGKVNSYIDLPKLLNKSMSRSYTKYRFLDKSELSVLDDYFKLLTKKDYEKLMNSLTKLSMIYSDESMVYALQYNNAPEISKEIKELEKPIEDLKKFVQDYDKVKKKGDTILGTKKLEVLLDKDLEDVELDLDESYSESLKEVFKKLILDK